MYLWCVCDVYCMSCVVQRVYVCISMRMYVCVVCILYVVYTLCCVFYALYTVVCVCMHCASRTLQCVFYTLRCILHSRVCIPTHAFQPYPLSASRMSYLLRCCFGGYPTPPTICAYLSASRQRGGPIYGVQGIYRLVKKYGTFQCFIYFYRSWDPKNDCFCSGSIYRVYIEVGFWGWFWVFSGVFGVLGFLGFLAVFIVFSSLQGSIRSIRFIDFINFIDIYFLQLQIFIFYSYSFYFYRLQFLFLQVINILQL